MKKYQCKECNSTVSEKETTTVPLYKLMNMTEPFLKKGIEQVAICPKCKETSFMLNDN
jgi:hypothetical protein